jgi:hypothetical protein
LVSRISVIMPFIIFSFIFFVCWHKGKVK